ncbi:MAG TPA: prephenate dehydrogenase/arogenate dehydrogenase family protein [Candidatus Eremiobacteraceae bacterium]|nr:prephenate dehydrogenase/arogenate dehydrogenase family protein [Candidatus Eremiobacteraceae bacterium]
MRSTVAILGTGLIGTSLGLALVRDRKERSRFISTAAASKNRERIVGWDVRPSNGRAALKRGGIAAIANSMEEAVRDAGVVVIATPLDAAIKLAPRVIGAATKGSLIIDVTPVKAPMLRATRAALRKRPDISYISAHPMAGREKGGAANADSDLFKDRPFALIQLTSNRRNADTRAVRLVKRVGARPVTMTAKAHDRAVAAMSALPQLASIALALAASQSGGKAAAKLAGPGFGDATRLAMSPYDIWKPALTANQRHIGRGLCELERTVARLARAARQEDVRAMERLFSKARSARKRVVGG